MSPTRRSRLAARAVLESVATLLLALWPAAILQALLLAEPQSWVVLVWPVVALAGPLMQIALAELHPQSPIQGQLPFSASYEWKDVTGTDLALQANVDPEAEAAFAALGLPAIGTLAETTTPLPRIDVWHGPDERQAGGPILGSCSVHPEGTVIRLLSVLRDGRLLLTRAGPGPGVLPLCGDDLEEHILSPAPLADVLAWHQRRLPADGLRSFAPGVRAVALASAEVVERRREWVRVARLRSRMWVGSLPALQLLAIPLLLRASGWHYGRFMLLVLALGSASALLVRWQVRHPDGLLRWWPPPPLDLDGALDRAGARLQPAAADPMITAVHLAEQWRREGREAAA